MKSRTEEKRVYRTPKLTKLGTVGASTQATPAFLGDDGIPSQAVGDTAPPS